MLSRMSRQDYERIDAVNWSTLKHMLRSPQHYRYSLLQKQEDTDAMRLGRAVHLATFEPSKWKSQVAIWDGGRRYGKEWDAFQRDHRGLEILKSEQADLALAIGESARAAAGTLIGNGIAEATMEWVNPLNGVRCKGRVDFVSEEHGLVDLKSCRSAAPADFSSASARMLYHAAMGWYSDGLEQIQQRRRQAIILAVETTKPHVTAVYELGEDVLQAGTETYQPLLDMVKSCRDSDCWPGYSRQALTLPRWLRPEDADDGTGLVFGSN